MRRRFSAVAVGAVALVAAAVLGAAVALPANPPKPTPEPKPAPRMASGVTIGGVHVGGLEADAAYAAVRAAFEARLVLLVGTRQAAVTPEELGTIAYVKPAVAAALHASPGAKLPLHVSIQGGLVRAYLHALALETNTKPVDATLLLRDLKPFVTQSKPGQTLSEDDAVHAVLQALVENRRTPLRLPLQPVPAKVSTDHFGPVVVVHRGLNKLILYDGMKTVRTFGVATGQAAYPTPLGRFAIVVKWRNPWWYPPNSPWAKGAKPIPPGPGNPLGTRWMGLTAPGVG